MTNPLPPEKAFVVSHMPMSPQPSKPSRILKGKRVSFKESVEVILVDSYKKHYQISKDKPKKCCGVCSIF